MKSGKNLVLVRENEISSADCSFCDRPFDLDYRNTEYAVEINGGSEWMHRTCARKFGEELVWISSPKSVAKEVESSQSEDPETQYPHFGPDE